MMQNQTVERKLTRQPGTEELRDTWDKVVDFSLGSICLRAAHIQILEVRGLELKAGI